MLRVCDVCGVKFQGHINHVACSDACRVELKKLRAKQWKIKVGYRKEPKVCPFCSKEFLGTPKAQACDPCKAAQAEALEEERRQKRNARNRALWASLAAIDVSKPVKQLPPACKKCHYCHETDAYPSGMACLAEAFLRCRPWHPGAKPLKERKDAT